jgi:hypothetical protein
MKGWILRTLSLAFVMIAAGAVSPARAAHLVTFTRGQSIVVQSFEKRGTWYYFILDGGGEMGVPLSRVTRIEDYEAPPPSAVASAPAQPMQAPAPVSGSQAPVAVNSGAPENGSGGSPDVQAGAPMPGDDPAANDPDQIEGWRRSRMNGVDNQGGAGSTQGPGGGIRKPARMGGAAGAGRLQGYPNNPNNNPYNRRRPPQTGNPTP